MKTEIYKKSILRITNRRRNKIVVKSGSDEDEESMVVESSDDEVEAEDEAEDEAEEHEMRISASRCPQRNIQLPVRYRG